MYDFGKILNSDFTLYNDEKIGFSIKYPSEMKIYKYDPKQDSRYINLSLVSQVAEGTELFDGLSIDFNFYKNNDNRSLEAIAPQKSMRAYPQEGDLLSREEVFINNIPMIKTFRCCWGGGDTVYYVLTKKDEYVVEIDIFSTGPDKEKFNKVADKIIQSFQHTL